MTGPNRRKDPVRAMLAVLLGFAGLAGAQPLEARQAIPPEAAPASWVAYAEQVNIIVTAWLSDDDPAAVELRAGLDATRADPDQPSTSITAKLWIDASGVITRAEANPIIAAAPPPDLGALLNGRAIGTSPPKGMLLPLRLAIQLDPAPQSRSAPAEARP